MEGSEIQGVALLELRVGPDERASLREAAELTGIADPAELIRIALAELIERRRFQQWVKEHDPAAARHGRA